MQSRYEFVLRFANRTRRKFPRQQRRKRRMRETASSRMTGSTTTRMRTANQLIRITCPTTCSPTTTSSTTTKSPRAASADGGGPSSRRPSAWRARRGTRRSGPRPSSSGNTSGERIRKSIWQLGHTSNVAIRDCSYRDAPYMSRLRESRLLAPLWLQCASSRNFLPTLQPPQQNLSVELPTRRLQNPAMLQ